MQNAVRAGLRDSQPDPIRELAREPEVLAQTRDGAPCAWYGRRCRGNFQAQAIGHVPEFPCLPETNPQIPHPSYSLARWFGTVVRAGNMRMDIRIRELHYRWIETPSEPIAIDEMPDPEPPPHPQPTDPPPTAALVEDLEDALE